MWMIEKTRLECGKNPLMVQYGINGPVTGSYHIGDWEHLFTVTFCWMKFINSLHYLALNTD